MRVQTVQDEVHLHDKVASAALQVDVGSSYIYEVAFYSYMLLNNVGSGNAYSGKPFLPWPGPHPNSCARMPYGSSTPDSTHKYCTVRFYSSLRYFSIDSCTASALILPASPAPSAVMSAHHCRRTPSQIREVYSTTWAGLHTQVYADHIEIAISELTELRRATTGGRRVSQSVQVPAWLRLAQVARAASHGDNQGTAVLRDVLAQGDCFLLAIRLSFAFPITLIDGRILPALTPIDALGLDHKVAQQVLEDNVHLRQLAVRIAKGLIPIPGFREDLMQDVLIKGKSLLRMRPNGSVMRYTADSLFDPFKKANIWMHPSCWTGRRGKQKIPDAGVPPSSSCPASSPFLSE